MLKYIQDIDFGKIEPQGQLRQKKIFSMKAPLQQLIKSRSVSQLLHDELITLQKSSARKQQRSIKLDRSPSPSVCAFEVKSPELPPIKAKPSEGVLVPKLRRRKQFVLKHNQLPADDEQQWCAAYLSQGSPSQSPPIKEIKRVLQDSFCERKLGLSFSLSTLKQSQGGDSPKKRYLASIYFSQSTNDKLMRCLLAEYVVDDKLPFSALVPESRVSLKDVEYMIEQVCMNFELMKSLFRLERTITKILLKTPGISKKIILTFFKEIKPNCPNDISKFDEHFKLRKQITKELIQAKFIIGHDPEYDQIIRKIILRHVDAFHHFHVRNEKEDSYQASLRQMEPLELLRRALECIRFDYEFLNKLNYFNINLQEMMKQKQMKAIQSKLHKESISLDNTSTMTFDQQPESILQKLNDCERRLGKFQKISNQERFKFMEADAYLYYR